MSSIWQVARLDNLTYPQLQTNLDVDTVVIGGGVTGLATALKLLDAGQRVAVVEALTVGAGSTGGSTGNLYSTLSEQLSKVRSKWDDEVLREVVALRALAVNFIEDTVQRFDIDCQFARRPVYFCISQPDTDQQAMLEAEYEASIAAGLDAQLVDSADHLPIPVHRALKIEMQAQYNPLRYAQGLAAAVTEMGGLIFEGSRVTGIDASKGKVTTEHAEVQAQHIVQATHTPKGINLLQAEMEPYREYGVAARLNPSAEQAPVPEGIFWMLSDSHSVRTYRSGGETYAVVVGEKHKTGLGSQGESYYRNLRDYLNEYFDMASVGYEWSAQQFKAADLLPYIGRSGHDNVYVATGFAADGLTWGTVASAIISNQILGRQSRGAELFDPRRFTPAKSAKQWAKENATVAKQLVQDYLSSSDLKDLNAVSPGEGKIVSLKGEEVAVYRSADNTLALLSPICPHMKCKVNWNHADATWDCPCHGSRFAADGAVLEGPSYEPLAQRPVRD